MVVVNHMIFYHCAKFEVVCLSCSGVIEETLQHHKTFERFCPSLEIRLRKVEPSRCSFRKVLMLGCWQNKQMAGLEWQPSCSNVSQCAVCNETVVLCQQFIHSILRDISLSVPEQIHAPFPTSYSLSSRTTTVSLIFNNATLWWPHEQTWPNYCVSSTCMQPCGNFWWTKFLKSHGCHRGTRKSAWPLCSMRGVGWHWVVCSYWLCTLLAACMRGQVCAWCTVQFYVGCMLDLDLCITLWGKTPTPNFP